MKSSQLSEIFKDGNVVIPVFFLKNFEKFQLEMDCFLFLMYLYNKGNNFLFNPSEFANELNLDLKKVMEFFEILTNKSFLKVDVVKNEKGFSEELVILNLFFDKISLLVLDEISNQKSEADSSVFAMIEKEFGRTLGPIEIEIITAWLNSNIDEDLIQEALKEAVFNGVFNLKYIDKILYEWGKKGYKTVQDVENSRKARNTKTIEKDSEIDIDLVDWNWFDDDE